ncbi:hypothetical protein IIA16_05810 [bacterium]|nr:hypothetical protein [bacterium]
MGLLIVPLLRLTGSSLGGAQVQETQAVLETARDALLAYAAANNGCLPYAADWEGGMSDTDKDVLSQPGYADSGVVREREDRPGEKAKVYSGDLPWAELGLTSDFLDSAGLRIQYYVAKRYVTKIQKPADVGVKPLKQKDRMCQAGFRGFEWDPTVVYKGTSRNFNAVMAPAARITVVEVDEIVEPGELGPEEIVTPGVYVDRIVKRPTDFSPYE